VGGTNYKCRDSELIGDIVAGAERTIPDLSIDVVAGDFIGAYWASSDGIIEATSESGNGLYRTAGEYIDPEDEATYTLASTRTPSLYGTGGEVVAYYHSLKVQGEGELALCDVENNPLRIRKGGTTYGIELVATDDPNASRIRIKTETGIKAIRKYT